MAEGGAKEYVTFEMLEQYQKESRCMQCKKRTFQDMNTCEKCREFRYCSIECLELNRTKHVPLCDIICLKKGTANMLDRQMVMSVRQKAKSLDEDDNFAVRNTIENLNNKPKAVQSPSETINKRRRCKKNKRKKTHRTNEDITEAKKSISPPPEIASFIAGGKFCGKVTVDGKVLSGTRFGDGWWKTKNEKDTLRTDVDETSRDSFEKQQKSHFPEYDIDTESDGDGSRRENNTKEATASENLTANSLSSMETPVTSLQSERLKDISESNSSNLNIKVRDNPVSNISATDDTTKASDPIGRSTEDRSAPSTKDTAAEIKSGEFKDSGPVSSRTGTADPVGTQSRDYLTNRVELVPYDKQKAEESEAASGGREPWKLPKWEKCLSCHKESYTMLKCSRCKLGSRYCNKSCQKEDFPRHKEFCKRSEQYFKALSKLAESYLMTENFRLGGPQLSTYLRHLTSEFDYIFLDSGSHYCYRSLDHIFTLSVMVS